MIFEKEVNSSNLSYVKYDDEDNTLYVTFKSGSTYAYYKVKQDVYDAIVNETFTNQNGEPSAGATFIKLVKNQNYKWKKLGD